MQFARLSWCLLDHREQCAHFCQVQAESRAWWCLCWECGAAAGGSRAQQKCSAATRVLMSAPAGGHGWQAEAAGVGVGGRGSGRS